MVMAGRFIQILQLWNNHIGSITSRNLETLRFLVQSHVELQKKSLIGLTWNPYSRNKEAIYEYYVY